MKEEYEPDKGMRSFMGVCVCSTVFNLKLCRCDVPLENDDDDAADDSGGDDEVDKEEYEGKDDESDCIDDKDAVIATHLNPFNVNPFSMLFFVIE